MARAIKEVNEKHGSIKSIAIKYGIPRTTLRRHLKTGSAKKKLGRFTTVFALQQEEELLEYVFHMDNLFFGLTKEDFLQLVFQYAEANNIPHPFKNGTAGHDFYKGFIMRHPDLSLRRPEPTSIARARGFNRSQVYRFFDLLEAEIEKHQIDAMRLYNMDETGIQTSSNKPPRVLTKLGKKQVGHIASTERGRTTTVICCCNAAGSFVPPLMIFARKRMAPNLLDGAPPGTQATVSDNGWTNGTVFLEWLRFFIDTVRPTAEKKVLLVMDNHESHKYLPALELASKNHVIFVSLAPHTTHRMQPLDFCVYGPLKTYFERSVATFQKTHVGRIINQKDVASLFATAYLRAATTQNAVSGFETTGLWPPNRFIFDDADFLPATTMENPPRIENPTQSGNQQHQQTLSVDGDNSRTPSPSIIEQLIIDRNYSKVLSSSVIEQFMNNDQSTMVTVPENSQASPPPSERRGMPILDNLVHNSVRVITPNDLRNTITNAEAPVTPPITRTSPVTTSLPDNTTADTNMCYISPMALRPLPKMTPNLTSRRRKAQRAEILTSTPIKNEQKEKLNKKQKATADKEKRVVKNLKGNLSGKEGSSGTQRRAKTRPNAKVKLSGTKNDTQKRSDNATNQHYVCLICMEPYEDPPVEDWIRCDDCQLWAHEACTTYSGIGAYYCDNCQEI